MIPEGVCKDVCVKLWKSAWELFFILQFKKCTHILFMQMYHPHMWQLHDDPYGGPSASDSSQASTRQLTRKHCWFARFAAAFVPMWRSADGHWSVVRASVDECEKKKKIVKLTLIGASWTFACDNFNFCFFLPLQLHVPWPPSCWTWQSRDSSRSPSRHWRCCQSHQSASWANPRWRLCPARRWWSRSLAFLWPKSWISCRCPGPSPSRRSDKVLELVERRRSCLLLAPLDLSWESPHRQSMELSRDDKLLAQR